MCGQLIRHRKEDALVAQVEHRNVIIYFADVNHVFVVVAQVTFNVQLSLVKTWKHRVTINVTVRTCELCHTNALITCVPQVTVTFTLTTHDPATE